MPLLEENNVLDAMMGVVQTDSNTRRVESHHQHSSLLTSTTHFSPPSSTPSLYRFWSATRSLLRV